MGSTVNERFIEIVDRRGENPAFKVKRDGAWENLSFIWGMDQVRRTAFAIEALGLRFEARDIIRLPAVQRDIYILHFGNRSIGIDTNGSV